MKNLLFVFFVSVSLLSCSQDKKPPRVWAVALMQLGSSKNEIVETLKSYEHLGGLRRSNSNHYYWSNKLEDVPYYNTPIFTFGIGDTILTELTILYFDQFDYLSENIKAVTNNEFFENLMDWDTARVKSRLLKREIENQIIKEHGLSTSKDTLDIGDHFWEITHWKDRSGLDIKLRFLVPKFKGVRHPLFTANSSLIVTYFYAEDIRRKYDLNWRGFENKTH